jgi:histidinol phosphatase-like PHP family hydrolase
MDLLQCVDGTMQQGRLPVDGVYTRKCDYIDLSFCFVLFYFCDLKTCKLTVHFSNACLDQVKLYYNSCQIKLFSRILIGRWAESS